MGKARNRKGSHEHEWFDFLGYRFRTRLTKAKNGWMCAGFTPAVSPLALKKIGEAIWRWRLHWHSDKALDELARYVNPEIRGWFNYYGRFNKSALYRIMRRINAYLARWVMRKYKRLSGHVRAWNWLKKVSKESPGLFAHWQCGLRP